MCTHIHTLCTQKDTNSAWTEACARIYTGVHTDRYMHAHTRITRTHFCSDIYIQELEKKKPQNPQKKLQRRYKCAHPKHSTRSRMGLATWLKLPTRPSAGKRNLKHSSALRAILILALMCNTFRQCEDDYHIITPPPLSCLLKALPRSYQALSTLFSLLFFNRPQ